VSEQAHGAKPGAPTLSPSVGRRALESFALLGSGGVQESGGAGGPGGPGGAAAQPKPVNYANAGGSA